MIPSLPTHRVKTLLLVSESMKNTVDSVKMDEFTLKDRELWKWGQSNLTNTALCLRGFEGGSGGQGWTNRRNLQMTKSLFGVLRTHFPWHPHTKPCKGQWDRDKSGQFHPCASIKDGDPTHYPGVLGWLCSPYPDAAAFLPLPPLPPPGRSDWGCLLHISFGLAFPLHKAAVNVFCVQGGGDGMFSGGPTAACIGGSSSLGLALCVPWKDMKSQLFGLSQAAGLFFSFWMRGVRWGRRRKVLQGSSPKLATAFCRRQLHASLHPQRNPPPLPKPTNMPTVIPAS